MSHKTEASTTLRSKFLGVLSQAGTKLVNRAKRRCVSPDEAEDIVQAAIEWCLANLDKYDTAASMKAWLYSVVDNKVMNMNDYYKNRGRATVRLEDFRPSEDEEDPGSTDISYDPSHDYDVTLSVQVALMALTKDEREITRSVLMEGVTIEQYAEETGMPVRTVERRLASAKENLKNLLSEWRVFHVSANNDLEGCD